MAGHRLRRSWDSADTQCVHHLPFELPLPSSPPRHKRPSFAHRWLPRALSARALALALVARRPSALLALYFALNLALTLYNKSLLLAFPFPYSLSALHALCSSLGCALLLRTRSAPLPRLSLRQSAVFAAFSALYTVNIVVSNVSLGLVTVPFHQVVRASTPLFTIVFSALILRTRSSHAKLLALLPVVAGLGFATYGDYYFTPTGFFLTLLGTILAALKTIYTNLLQKPRHHPPAPPFKPALAPDPPHRTLLPPLSPLHILYLLSPLAFVQTTLIALCSGELQEAYHTISPRIVPHPQPAPTNVYMHDEPWSLAGTLGLRFDNARLALLLLNGLMAFALNVVSFSANRKVGALSMTVAANVKQVLTILCAVSLFDLTITPMNAFGIALTLVGGVVYTWVDLRERQRRERIV